MNRWVDEDEIVTQTCEAWFYFGLSMKSCDHFGLIHVELQTSFYQTLNLGELEGIYIC
jgi:hypothetical protein